MISIVTDKDFESIVLKADKPFLLELWSEWCAPCKMMGAVVDEFSEQYSGQMEFGRLNSDDNTEVVKKYDVNGVPTLLLFVDGKVKEKFVGLTPKDIMERTFDYHI